MAETKQNILGIRPHQHGLSYSPFYPLDYVLRRAGADTPRPIIENLPTPLSPGARPIAKKGAPRRADLIIKEPQR